MSVSSLHPAPLRLAGEIRRILSTARVDLSDEKRTQADIEQELVRALPDSLVVEREARLEDDLGIIDFLVGCVGVEVKRRSGSPRSILRQLERYSRSTSIDVLVLASNKAMALPAALNGVPLYRVSLGAGWLL